MDIEINKKYFLIRKICAAISIMPIVIVEIPTTMSRAAKYINCDIRIGYKVIRENGKPIGTAQYLFLDSREMKNINEHCYNLGNYIYLTNTKDMTNKLLYKLLKLIYNVKETLPFKQNFSIKTDSYYCRKYYQHLIDKIKNVNI